MAPLAQAFVFALCLSSRIPGLLLREGGLKNA